MADLWNSFPWGIQAFLIVMFAVFAGVIAALPYLTGGGSLSPGGKNGRRI